ALELYYGEGCPRVQVVWHRSPENRLEEGAIRRETEFLGFGFRATGPCQLPGSTQATRFWEVARAKVAGAAGAIRKMQWGAAVAVLCLALVALLSVPFLPLVGILLATRRFRSLAGRHFGCWNERAIVH